jgi:hypothetical protein
MTMTTIQTTTTSKGMPSWKHWKKNTAKAILPVVGTTALATLALYTVFQIVASKESLRTQGMMIRLGYGCLFTIGMEYIARYEHQHLWHSRYLWYFHASHHHHQTPAKLGQGMMSAIRKEDRKTSTALLELNDIFAVVFATLAILLIFWGMSGTPTLCKDCVVGMAGGISVYGTSYFVGHDLCAHERGGPALAAWLRRMSPTMNHCATVHVKYHHRVSTTALRGEDPYSAPYGFWLGPSELTATIETEGTMPKWLPLAFWGSGMFFLYTVLTSSG